MLQGYGISLDIKNMEYKAIDDTKHASESDSGANDNDAVNAKNADEDLSIPVEGFIFSILLQRKPTLETELSQFRESLLELAASKTDNIKLWDMANMGIAAVQRIVGETESSLLDDNG
jgi:UDP-glucose:glycoprotein glucosyltransferase